MRDSPTIPLVEALHAAGAELVLFDPEAMTGAKALLPAGPRYASDAIDAVTDADAMVVATEWNEFRALAPDRLRDLLRGDVVVYLRNVYDPAAMAAAGLRYSAIGRPGA